MTQEDENANMLRCLTLFGQRCPHKKTGSGAVRIAA
jgi:hypothetical protein